MARITRAVFLQMVRGAFARRCKALDERTPDGMNKLGHLAHDKSTGPIFSLRAIVRRLVRRLVEKSIEGLRHDVVRLNLQRHVHQHLRLSRPEHHLSPAVARKLLCHRVHVSGEMNEEGFAFGILPRTLR